MIFRRGNRKDSKRFISNWLLLVFLLAVIFSGAFSEFFQTPDKLDQDLLQYQQLFRPEQLATIKKLEITNKLGHFVLKKDQKMGKSYWKLKHPRTLAANQEIVNKILLGLQGIRILRIYPKDAITIANYSLNVPMMKIQLTDSFEQQTNVNIGLVNPIDNSTYLTVSDHDALFHVEKLKFPIGVLSLTDLIDSTVFSLSLKDMAKINIYRGNPKNKNLSFNAQLKNKRWVNRQNRFLDAEKIQTLFQKLGELKSLFILDQIGEKLEKEIQKYTNRPLYTVEFYDHQNNSYTYTLTHVLPKLSGVKMEGGQNFMITSTDGRYPRLVDKNYLKLFNITDRALVSSGFR